MKRRTTEDNVVSRACKRIERNADAVFHKSMDVLEDIRHGRLSDQESKYTVAALGQATKSVHADVQNRHAEQNHVKQAMQLAAQDRENIKYTGPQADLLVAAMEAIEGRDAAPIRELKKVA